jgi:hypothetical protein
MMFGFFDEVGCGSGAGVLPEKIFRRLRGLRIFLIGGY